MSRKNKFAYSHFEIRSNVLLESEPKIKILLRDVAGLQESSSGHAKVTKKLEKR